MQERRKREELVNYRWLLVSAGGVGRCCLCQKVDGVEARSV